MALDIRIIKKKDYAYVVELKGSLDTDTYTDLSEELDEIISDNTKLIVFDMSGVTYISSAGVGVVMTTKKSLKEKSATFAMVNLQPQIEKVFSAMKILGALDVLEDMVEADRYIDQIIKEETAKQNI